MVLMASIGVLVDRQKQWDDGEIALRGALLYSLGCNLPESVKKQVLEHEKSGGSEADAAKVNGLTQSSKIRLY